MEQRRSWRLMRWCGLSFALLGLLSHWMSATAEPLVPAVRAWAPWLSALSTLALAGLLWHATRELVSARQISGEEAVRNQAVLDALPIGLVLFDRDDRLVLSNRDFLSLYPEMAGDIRPGIRFEELLRLAVRRGAVPAARSDPEGWIALRLAEHHSPGEPVVRLMADGRWRRIAEQRLADGSLLAHSVDVTDMQQRERELRSLNTQLDVLNAELSQLSKTDPLTGLANRRQFDRQLALEWTRAQRHGIPLALLMLDVDHFKRFNDRHGHLAGDACLREVAALLRGAAQRPTDLVARVGGEEFAVLLPHHDGAEAEVVAARCLAVLAHAAIPHGGSPTAAVVTMSIGIGHVAHVPADLESAALVASADAALYRAKREGRNRCVCAPRL